MEAGIPNATEITRLLEEWKSGDRAALDRLIPYVYEELRTVASRQLALEWRHKHLQTTAVVNEVYLRLFAQRDVDWRDRGHFFAIAAQLMRRILVDHARHELSQKRGGDAIHVDLVEAEGVPEPGTVDAIDALSLDGALQRLEELDRDQARIVELRFFGGLTVEETASSLGISPATVKREWALAKAWLYRELAGTTLREDAPSLR